MGWGGTLLCLRREGWPTLPPYLGTYTAYWGWGDATLSTWVREGLLCPPISGDYYAYSGAGGGGRLLCVGRWGLLCPLFLGPTLPTEVGGGLLCLRG